MILDSIFWKINNWGRVPNSLQKLTKLILKFTRKCTACDLEHENNFENEESRSTAPAVCLHQDKQTGQQNSLGNPEKPAHLQTADF